MILVLAINITVLLVIGIILLVWWRKNLIKKTNKRNLGSRQSHIMYHCWYSEGASKCSGKVRIIPDLHSDKDSDNDIDFGGPTLSKCENCSAECNFNMEEYSYPLASLSRVREGLFDIMSSMFNISNDDKRIIEDNSSSTVIRCLDVFHRVYHRGDELNMDKVREKIYQYK